MARDFLSDQIRTKQLIGSGSQGSPKITVISDAEAPNNDGTIVSGVLDNVGDDVFLFVSGTIDGKANNTPDSVTLFGGDVVISGTLYAENQIIEVIAEATGSLEVSGSIVHSSGINIGDAEDGTYTDGLFSDFTSSTLLGTAIDRFNEVLKGLAPKKAPELDNFSALPQSGTGSSVKLSFGTLNDQASAGYESVIALNGFNAVDVNETYEPEQEISGSYKLGFFSKDTAITGVLNEIKLADVYTNNIVNYPENSFSNADDGELQLRLNGNIIHTLTLLGSGTGLPGSGTGSSLNSNGSGFINLSESAPGKFASEQTFETFKHRTGSWIVDPSDQLNGFNYVQVVHVIGSEERLTGTAQWVNDNNADALAASNNNITLSLSGSKHLSGVEYFTGGEATYSTDIANFYKYVYGITPVTFIETSTPVNILSLNSFNVPQIVAPEDHTKVLEVSSTNNLTLPASQRIIDGQISVTSNITHPRKSILQSSTQASATQILIDNSSNTSTKTIENFDDEVYRMISTTYNLQTDISLQNFWDSTQTITSGNTGYSDGLMVHNGRLMSTKNTSLPNNGNFGTMLNGPAGNPDYSNGNILTAPKKYIRRFTNTTSNTVRDISYNILGEGIINSHSANLGSDTTNFKLYYKLPGSTAWLDSATDFSYNNVSSDGNGGKIGNFNNNIESNPTNYLTFGTSEIAPNESILVKVESNKTWQGVLENLSVNFGAVGTVLPSPDTDNIDVSNTGITGKLSFGSSLTKAGYTDVSSVGSSTSVDANEDYNITSFANNIRKGIFDGTQTITGEINEDIPSQGNNYPANAWGSGQSNVGELKLELNGVIISACTIDLTTFGSGNSLDSNNTGFTGITAASVGLDNNGLPDYRYFYRTGSFQIDSSSQRNGWNYVRVLHDLDGGTTVYETNYAEWVNDNNSDALVSAVSGLTADYDYSVVSSANTSYLSGVEYFNSPVQMTYQDLFGVLNVYKYVYSNSSNAISVSGTNSISITEVSGSGDYVTQNNASGSGVSLPLLDLNNANAYDTNLKISGLCNYVSDICIPGNASSELPEITATIEHPIKNNLNITTGQMLRPLIYTVNDSESNLVEDFSAESYRLQDKTYSSQSDVTNANNAWDSSIKLNDVSNSGHNTGLMFYNDKLIRPQYDFSYTDLNDLINSFASPTPGSQADYTTGITGTRTFYRKIQNRELSSKFNFAITIQGTGTLISNIDTLGSNNDNFRMFIKLPTTTNSQATGWLDFRLPFQTGQVSDNDGCRTGGDPNTMTNTLSQLGTEFEGTFGTQYAYSDASQNGDYVVIKIEADSSWTGNISNIEFEWR